MKCKMIGKYNLGVKNEKDVPSRLNDVNELDSSKHDNGTFLLLTILQVLHSLYSI